MDLDQRNVLTRKRIGIIAGAGPEAGIDLWQKILEANKASLGAAFGGDMDAPDVTIFSIPRLGLSMEIERNEDVIWAVLEEAILAQAERVDIFCIACNVLHHYSDKINGLGLRAEFVSIIDVVRDYLSENHVERAALLSIGKVVQLGKWSPYAVLREQADFEVPSDMDGLTRIVADVKRLGPYADGVRGRFSDILAAVQSDVILLACTELPLVAPDIPGKTLVDVTRLLAEAMARKSLGIDCPRPSHHG